MSDQPWLKKLLDRGTATRLTIPKATLDELDWQAGDNVALTIDDGRLIVQEGHIEVGDA
jgi:bifunctional DNA-binding transcriptional regulator/antitoxin component of YhaV-PrlF toxin-antitoxin module